MIRIEWSWGNKLHVITKKKTKKTNVLLRGH